MLAFYVLVPVEWIIVNGTFTQQISCGRLQQKRDTETFGCHIPLDLAVSKDIQK
jgi:hypothetical protein